MQAPPPASSNRRRSAPSPRLQPGVLPTRHDFQTWALANGVPHAPGGPAGPIYSHHLQPSPLAPSSSVSEEETSAMGVQAGQQHLINGNLSAEALECFQQASQALSRANLQHQQQQVQAVQNQQQLLASLPALLGATNLRNYRPPPRRLNDATYRNYRQPPHHHLQQHQYLQAQQKNLVSPSTSTSASNHLLPSSAGHLSRSTNSYSGHSAPMLERRSSWDGAQATPDSGQQYLGSSSVSEAGAGELGPATAPTSPGLNGVIIPTFPRASAPSSASSIISTPSPTLTAFNGYTASGENRPMRGQRGYGTRYEHSQAQASGTGARGRPYRQRDDDFARSQASAFPSPIPLGLEAVLPKHGREQPQLAPVHASPIAEASSNPHQSPHERGTHTLQQSEDQEDVPLASSIRFGNFDAAYYSSEPAEMAGLGLFDGIPGADAPDPSKPARKPEESPPAPDEAPQIPPVSVVPARSQNAALPISTPHNRSELADISASPAKRNTPASPNMSRQPSTPNRRRSAGDEADLGLDDVTFFGDVPVNHNEGQRKQAMAALLKESCKDFKVSSLASSQRKIRRTSTSSSTTNESSSLLQLRNILPSSTSSSASVASTSTSASPSEPFGPETPVEIALPLSEHSEQRSTPIPVSSSASIAPAAIATSASLHPEKQSNTQKSTGRKPNFSSSPMGTQAASYASLAASPASALSGRPRRRTGS